MKKKIWLVFVLSVMCMTGIACNKGSEETNSTITMEDIPEENIVSADASYWTYNYEELKEEAEVIAKVKVIDELSLENSKTSYTDGWLAGTCSLRDVEVIEFYKNESDYKVGDVFPVQQSAAIYQEGDQYYMESLNDEKPLEKDGIYVLFLKKYAGAMTDELIIISGENGIIDLDEITDDKQYFDISVKTLVEYESDMQEEEKQEILDSTEIVMSDEKLENEAVIEAEEETKLEYEVNGNGAIEVNIQQ